VACAIVPARPAHAAPGSEAFGLVAADAAADSVASGDDQEPGVVTVGPDSVRVRRTPPPPAPKGRFSKPKWVMLRSLVFPGWGQAYNHAWFKSAFIAAGETVLIVAVVRGEQDLSKIQDDVSHAAATGDTELEDALIGAYNAKLSQVTTREYLLGAVVVYAMIDAYVDAHFRNFKFEFEGDPALPGGVPRDAGVRVGWEWTF
jgi:hypothetical protein